jgi:hypothetical protein
VSDRSLTAMRQTHDAPLCVDFTGYAGRIERERGCSRPNPSAQSRRDVCGQDRSNGDKNPRALIEEPYISRRAMDWRVP